MKKLALVFSLLAIVGLLLVACHGFGMGYTSVQSCPSWSGLEGSCYVKLQYIGIGDDTIGSTTDAAIFDFSIVKLDITGRVAASQLHNVKILDEKGNEVDVKSNILTGTYYAKKIGRERGSFHLSNAGSDTDPAVNAVYVAPYSK